MSEKDLQDDVQYVELTDEQLEQFSGGDDKGFIAAGSKVDLKCPACWSREVYRMFTFSTIIASFAGGWILDASGAKALTFAGALVTAAGAAVVFLSIDKVKSHR